MGEPSEMDKWILKFVFYGLFFLACGCRTAPPLPRANLNEPGWTIRQGQTVWHTEGGREIAGDVLVATRAKDEAVVQFSKSPFTLVMAQSSGARWQVDFPPEHKHYSGRGQGPTRIIWLFLPRALSNSTLPKTLTWRQNSQGWKLEDTSTGEFLEGYFSE